MAERNVKVGEQGWNRKKPAAAPKRMTQAERTALSDQRMFNAAMQLITVHGTHNTTLKEVGEKAGYSRGLASGRFGSKEALFNELVTIFNRRWKAESRTKIGNHTGFRAFHTAVDAVIYFMVENTDYVRAMFILYYETIGSSHLLRERLADQHSAYRRDAARWVEEAIESGDARPNSSPERFAIYYTSFLFGVIYQWLVSPETIDFKKALENFRDSAVAEIASEKYLKTYGPPRPQGVF